MKPNGVLDPTVVRSALNTLSYSESPWLQLHVSACGYCRDAITEQTELEEKEKENRG